MAQKVIHGGQVEIKLADIARSEGTGFQFDDDVAPELEMVKEEVERVVFIAYFQSHLPPDEGETGAQLKEEFLDVIDERTFDLGLAAGIGGAEEVEEVGVFEKLRSHVGVHRGHGEGEVILCLTRAEVELALYLDFQDGATPAVGEGFADIEVASDGVFDHLKQADDLAPWQLRNRLFRNCTVRECLGKKLHREQVARRKSAHVRKGFLEIRGEAVNDSGSPCGFLLAGEDDFPGVPVGFDDDGIGGEDGADAGTAEMGLYLLERSGVAFGQGRGRWGDGEDGLFACATARES
ncbi:hypothetical protein CCP4SC76_4650006 [Gammaproteobacteria bacterium]